MFNCFGKELSCLSCFGVLEKLYLRLFGSLSLATYRRFLSFKYFSLSKLKNTEQDKILDFGCGVGGFGFSLARIYPEANVFLHDISDDSKERCEKIIKADAYQNVLFAKRDALDNEKNFSLVILADVLEHIEEDKETLEFLYQRMKSGAHLHLSVPWYKGEELSGNDYYHGHVRTGYTEEGIKALLEEVGFSIVFQPEYGKRAGFFVSLFDKAYRKLTIRPTGPMLDFNNVTGLSFVEKLFLALIWPFYKLSLITDIMLSRKERYAITLLLQKPLKS